MKSFLDKVAKKKKEEKPEAPDKEKDQDNSIKSAINNFNKLISRKSKGATNDGKKNGS